MTTDDSASEKRSSNSTEDSIHVEWDEHLQPSMATVEAVASAVGRSSTDLSPLYECINPEALDAIVGPDSSGSGHPVRVSFTYEGADVHIDSQRGIEIRLDGVDDASQTDSSRE